MRGASLDSFPQEFQQGMAARAELLGDIGENAPEHWESPLGTKDVHVALAAVSPDVERLEAILERACARYRALPGIEAIWRQDVSSQAGERTSFGFRDSLSNPAVEGSGIPGTNPQEAPIKAGEFLLGYRNEMGGLTPLPQPELLGPKRTYLVFPSCTPGWPRTVSTFVPRPRIAPRRSGWPPKSSAASPAARRWCSRRTG